MNEKPIDFSRFGDLTHFGLVKLVKGQYVLTPKGQKVLAANPTHSKTVAALLQQQNVRLQAQARDLRVILSAKYKPKHPKKIEGYIFPKPPAIPKRRRKPGKWAGNISLFHLFFIF